MVGRLDVVLAALVFLGFAVAWAGHGQPVLVRISELTDADVGRLVLLVGQVRWQNGTRLQLCQGSACVRAVVFGRLEADWTGRTVAVQGKWQKDAVLVQSRQYVDVLG